MRPRERDRRGLSAQPGPGRLWPPRLPPHADGRGPRPLRRAWRRTSRQEPSQQHPGRAASTRCRRSCSRRSSSIASSSARRARQDGGRNKYTDFEMASRLASLLWVSVPDDALHERGGEWQPVDAGGRAGRKRSACWRRRRRTKRIANFANDLYGLDPSSGTPLTTTFKDPAFYPNWTKTLPGRHAAGAAHAHRRRGLHGATTCRCTTRRRSS